MSEPGTRLKKMIDEFKKVKELSSKCSWYAHSGYDSYRYPNPTVRGPYFRWFVLEHGDKEHQDRLSPPDNDALYCATAMRNFPKLLDALELLIPVALAAHEEACGCCDSSGSVKSVCHTALEKADKLFD